MGLDWIPIAKPIPGKETEFKTAYEKILASRSDEEAQKVMEFMRTVSINSRSELEVPIVGRDVEASEYLTKVHKERDIQEPLADFIKRHDGFWVWQIAKPSDGIPEFSNSCTYTNVDGSSFRAEFLKDAEWIIGSELFEKAHRYMLGAELCDYADELEVKLKTFCERERLDISSFGDHNPIVETEEPAWSIRILLSAIKYLRFWGERGYFIQAWY